MPGHSPTMRGQCKSKNTANFRPLVYPALPGRVHRLQTTSKANPLHVFIPGSRYTNMYLVCVQPATPSFGYYKCAGLAVLAEIKSGRMSKNSEAPQKAGNSQLRTTRTRHTFQAIHEFLFSK